MLLHTVLFWLRNDLSPAQINLFETGLRSLVSIPTVRLGFIGKPADTASRPSIDHSYSYKLVVGFDDLAGHDVYQDIQAHLDFLANCRTFWTKVQIYDANELTV